jgi:hypothetical protein
VDEACDDRLARGQGLREEAAAHGHHGLVANTGCALREEDDREAIAKALGHTFRSLRRRAARSASHVDGAGHHADPTQNRRLAEFDLRDEDAGAHRRVDEDVDVGEVVGDDGTAHGNRADCAVSDVLCRKKSIA